MTKCRDEPRPAAFHTAVSQGEWELRELAGAPAPTGAGGRRATLRFDTGAARVSDIRPRGALSVRRFPARPDGARRS